MKSTSSSNSKSGSATNSKSNKKNGKEREKRKSQTDKDSSEKGSPAKDGMRKYAGISLESVSIYAEQAELDNLVGHTRTTFAEDLSYKLRHIIHDALIRARISGRNHIISTDIDATFDSLNIEKVYGAPANPSWMPIPEQNLSYLDDAVVNLVDIAEEECTYIQPGDVKITKKWLPEIEEMSGEAKHYFETMCNAIVSEDLELWRIALNDIRTNSCIGPVVEWFYNFCYILLSKDITYESLTLSALKLIESLECSVVASVTVSEKVLYLIVRLILQRLLKSHSRDIVKPMCFTLGMLCKRIPIQDLVLSKLKQKLSEIMEWKPMIKKAKKSIVVSDVLIANLVQLITIVNAVGLRAILEIFLPNMQYFMLHLDEENFCPAYVDVLLNTYMMISNGSLDNHDVNTNFYDVFGDGLIYMWPTAHIATRQNEEEPESNSLAIMKKLVRTRYYTAPVERSSANSYSLADIFPDNNFHKGRLKRNLALKIGELPARRTISIKMKSANEPIANANGQNGDHRNGTHEVSDLRNGQDNSVKQSRILIGKRTLLIPVFKGSSVKFGRSTCCSDYNLATWTL